MSKASSRAAGRFCAWCVSSTVDERRIDSIYCSRKCRQAAWRLRQRSGINGVGPGTEAGAQFGYADPPYIGTAARYYKNEPSYAGEVDHAELIEKMVRTEYAGWALSCSSDSLREILPLCPEGVRIGAWVKPIGVPQATFGMHNTWEAVIFCGGRKRPPGVRDWLRAQPARYGGTLTGRKPLAFCAWLFDCLGMLPGDTLDDLFPGTSIVTTAWNELSSRYRPTRDRYRGDGSRPRGVDDASPGAADDASTAAEETSKLEQRHVDDAGGTS